MRLPDSRSLHDKLPFLMIDPVTRSRAGEAWQHAIVPVDGRMDDEGPPDASGGPSSPHRADAQRRFWRPGSWPAMGHGAADANPAVPTSTSCEPLSRMRVPSGAITMLPEPDT